MSNLTKVLIGAGITVVGIGVTVVYAKKAKEKRHIDIPTNKIEVVEQEDDSVIERIKVAAAKKAIRILAWMVLHKSQIEAVGAVVGVFSALINGAIAIKDFTKSNKMYKQIEEMYCRHQKIQDAWNGTIDAYDANWVKLFDKLQDIHLDIPHDGMAS